MKENGELSDEELEGVVGGKGRVAGASQPIIGKPTFAPPKATAPAPLLAPTPKMSGGCFGGSCAVG